MIPSKDCIAFMNDPTFYWAVTAMKLFRSVSFRSIFPQSFQILHIRIRSKRRSKTPSPGFEPGSAAWEASALTVRLSRFDFNFNRTIPKLQQHSRHSQHNHDLKKEKIIFVFILYLIGLNMMVAILNNKLMAWLQQKPRSQTKELWEE